MDKHVCSVRVCARDCAAGVLVVVCEYCGSTAGSEAARARVGGLGGHEPASASASACVLGSGRCGRRAVGCCVPVGAWVRGCAGACLGSARRLFGRCACARVGVGDGVRAAGWYRRVMGWVGPVWCCVRRAVACGTGAGWHGGSDVLRRSGRGGGVGEVGRWEVQVESDGVLAVLGTSGGEQL